MLGEGEAQRSGRRRPLLLASTFEAVAGALYHRPGVRTGPRLAGPARRARTGRRSGDRRAQEPEEPAPGVHPADQQAIARRTGSPTPPGLTTRSRSGSRSWSAGSCWVSARDPRGERPRPRPRPRRSSGCGAGPPGTAPTGPDGGSRVSPADHARANPRLLALRMQGFKSFAERTSVEFGPGISAIVGPNGSGKSNLADALRWALGEQGRALGRASRRTSSGRARRSAPRRAWPT